MLYPTKMYATVAILATGLLAGSALAGPDWTTIERARAEKQVKQMQLAKRDAAACLPDAAEGVQPDSVVTRSAEPGAETSATVRTQH